MGNYFSAEQKTHSEDDHESLVKYKIVDIYFGELKVWTWLSHDNKIIQEVIVENSLNDDVRHGLAIDGQWVLEKKSCSELMDDVPEEFMEFYKEWETHLKSKPGKPEIEIQMVWEDHFDSVKKSNNEIPFGNLKIWTWLGADGKIIHEVIFENRLSHEIKHGLAIGGQWVLGESNSEDFTQSEEFKLTDDTPEEVVQFFQEWESHLKSKPDQPQIEIEMVLEV
jgi:hypothetical protein